MTQLHNLVIAATALDMSPLIELMARHTASDADYKVKVQSLHSLWSTRFSELPTIKLVEAPARETLQQRIDRIMAENEQLRGRA